MSALHVSGCFAFCILVATGSVGCAATSAEAEPSAAAAATGAESDDVVTGPTAVIDKGTGKLSLTAMGQRLEFEPGNFWAMVLTDEPPSSEEDLFTERTPGALASRGAIGTQFVATAVNARNGVVAIAVRTNITVRNVPADLVFLVDTRSKAFRDRPMDPYTFSFVPFVGSKNGEASFYYDVEGWTPFSGLKDGALAFTREGRLTVTMRSSEASGTVTYNPNYTRFACTLTGGGKPACSSGAR